MLKGLLDAKKYQEFQNVIDKHFCSEDKMDVASSQKVTNIVMFHMSNELKVFDVEIFSMLIKCFQIALASKQNSIPNGLFKIVKELRLRLDKNHPNITEEMIDQFAIKNEVVKLPLLLLKLDRKLGNFLDISKVPFKNWIVHK